MNTLLSFLPALVCLGIPIAILAYFLFDCWKRGKAADELDKNHPL